MAQSKQLAALYSGTIFAVIISAFRLGLRIRHRQKWLADDWIVGAATVILLLRLGLNHVILLYGTNMMSPEERMLLTDVTIAQKELGSMMNIIVRLCYITYLWMMKCCLLVFYQRLVSTLPAYDMTVKAFWATMVVSYLSIVMVCLLECRPFHLFWQVVPPPGKCGKTIIKTYLLGILNIITDVMLFIFPLPIIISLRASVTKKLRLYALLCIGIIVILITVIRLPKNVKPTDPLASKIFWCSFEIAAATLVANACVIYSMISKRKHKASATEQRDFEASSIQGLNFVEREASEKSSSGDVEM